jgi:hypothetical protein
VLWSLRSGKAQRHHTSHPIGMLTASGTIPSYHNSAIPNLKSVLHHLVGAWNPNQPDEKTNHHGQRCQCTPKLNGRKQNLRGFAPQERLNLRKAHRYQRTIDSKRARFTFATQASGRRDAQDSRQEVVLLEGERKKTPGRRNPLRNRFSTRSWARAPRLSGR